MCPCKRTLGSALNYALQLERVVFVVFSDADRDVYLYVLRHLASVFYGLILHARDLLPLYFPPEPEASIIDQPSAGI